MKSLFDNLKDTLGSFAQAPQNNRAPQQNNSPLGGMGGMLGATAVGGLLGALLGGSNGVQRAARNVAVVGAGAAAAGLAYSFLKKWRDNKAAEPAAAQAPQPAFPSPAAGYQPAASQPLSYEDQGALLLLKAMIFSARADGHIDASEQTLIDACAKDFGANVQSALSSFMTCPLDPNALARELTDPSLKDDLYKLSAAVIIADNFMEQSYLAGLAQALGLSAEQKAVLDNEAAQIRAQLSAPQSGTYLTN